MHLEAQYESAKLVCDIQPQKEHTTPFMISRDACLGEAFNFFRPFTEDDIFLDIGSGDGRVLMRAMREGCKTVFGIEVDGGLAEESRRRIADLVEKTRTRTASSETVAEVSSEETQLCSSWTVFEGRFENIARRDFRNFELRECTKVYLFMDVGGVEVVSPILNEQLPSGASVVSLDFPLDTEHVCTRLKLQLTRRVGHLDIYCYSVVV